MLPLVVDCEEELSAVLFCETIAFGGVKEFRHSFPLFSGIPSTLISVISLSFVIVYFALPWLPPDEDDDD